MAVEGYANWPFAEVIDFQEGPGILAKDFKDEGVPLVRLAGLDVGASILNGCNYLDPEMVAKKWSHFALKEGDIILSTSASLGRVAVVGAEGVDAIAYTGLIRMRPRDHRVFAPFIRYLLASSDFQNQIEAAGVGSVIKHFGPMHLKRMSLNLPSPEEQRTITHILGTLDDKIELIRRMNETLEAIARALFKSWFVDFDPVRAKMNGEPPETICQRLGLTPDLLALFPDRLVDSELGEIPVGWGVSSIGEQVEVVGGGTPSTKESEYWEGGTIHWTTPKDLSGLPDKVLLRTERKITEKGLQAISSDLLPIDTVLMSSRAPVGYLALAKVPTAINQGFIAMKCSKRLPPEYVIQWADSVMDEIKQRASGTTFAEISKKTFRSIPVVVPPLELLNEYAKITKAIYGKITLGASESFSLGELRDTLLPKLLSGELLVTELDSE